MHFQTVTVYHFVIIDESYHTEPMEGSHSRVSEFCVTGTYWFSSAPDFPFVMFSVFYLMTMLGNCWFCSRYCPSTFTPPCTSCSATYLSSTYVCASFATQRWSWTSLLEHEDHLLWGMHFLRSSFCTSFFTTGLKLLLISMSFDRYIATKPLHYSSIMSQEILYVLGLWQLLGQWASL